MIGFNRNSEETLSLYGKRKGIGRFEAAAAYNVASSIRKEGVIDKVYFVGKMPCCDVSLVRGGLLKFVPYPGGTIDTLTNNIHGDLIQPISGQRVMISFSEGDIQNPYISAFIFRSADGNLAAAYMTVPQLKFGDGDIIRSHRAGGRQVFSGFTAADAAIVTEFDETVDPLGGSAIRQKKGLNDMLVLGNIIEMGDGGKVQAFEEVACSNVNYVLTSLGMMPILPSSSIGPRIGVGTSVRA